MGRKHTTGAKPEQSVVDSALASMSAEELRGIIHVILLELDDRAHGRVMSSIIDRATIRGSGWTPRGPSRDEVSEIVAFVEAARRVGYADPSEIDDYLRQGSNAFLSKDYPAAVQILRELLISIGDGEIDLGQHEMVDEVLGVDVAVCAAQYVVSTYMSAAPADRAKVVRDAIEEIRGVGHFWEPLREMERVAVEPLVDLDEFLQRWRGLIEENAKTERQSDWDTDTDRWLREVAQRMEGADGLARIARSTRRADDLRAWCRVLMESKSWKAALAACEEAAEIVADKEYWRGEFLDDAALAAQELRRKDLPARLERAWRQTPSTLRLFRWLGSARSKAVLRKRAAQALDVCPKKSHRQRALLHLVLGNHESAAKLLAAAPGLGWSDSEHPGHLLFPVLHRLLGGEDMGLSVGTRPPSRYGMGLAELGSMVAEQDRPRLATPEVDDILHLAGVAAPASAKARKAVVGAMRTTAEKRVAGVTDKKRRRYYGHAAQLVTACAAIEPTSESSRWVAGIRSRYRRYPALQRELVEHLGRA